MSAFQPTAAQKRTFRHFSFVPIATEVQRGIEAMRRRQSEISYNEDNLIKWDKRFVAHLRQAIAAGLEQAPIGISTAPGTKFPKYVPQVTSGSTAELPW